LGAGPQQLVDGYARGLSTVTQGEDCAALTMRAAITCGSATTAVIASGPTVVVPALTALFGGMACGLAVSEAYVCFANER
jgi:hypothetical protein